MEMMTREMINNGLVMNGAIAGKLPNMRQVNPTKAINKELNKLAEKMNKDVIAIEENKRSISNDNIPNIDYCVEQITEDVEWVNDTLDLIYGKAYEGGIRYTESIESPFINKLY